MWSMYVIYSPMHTYVLITCACKLRDYITLFIYIVCMIVQKDTPVTQYTHMHVHVCVCVCVCVSVCV